MKLLILSALLAVASAAVPLIDNSAYNYHERVGILEAERIKQAEAAIDFDGSRIIGGSQSSLGSQPFLGGLVITLTDGRTSVCGSSLLSDTRAVTAAHCWSDGSIQARQFQVVLGSTTLFSGGVRITTSNVRVHESWNPRTIHNDVAVITIARVSLSNNIQPIALASGSNQYVGSWAVASGYGITSDSQSGVPSNTVRREVNLRVITNDECRRSYGSPVIASTICTSGQGGVGTCGGDSGGPLAFGSGNSRVLIGITSFGAVRCQAGHPSAYARVTSFNSWIRARL